MKETTAVFLERIDRTQAVSSFRFRPKEPIEFCAGQFTQVVFDAQNRQNKALNKYISFSSRPGKEFFELTKRKSDSEFSHRLWSLKNKDEVLVKAPMGTCIFDKSFERVAFLIGGIGITPVVSILEHIAFQHSAVDAVLVYSNLHEQDIPFKQELDAWRCENKNIRVVYTIVEQEPTNKEHLKGIITQEIVKAQIPDFLERIFFISGPPTMVGVMKAICQDIGCDMNKVKTENFIGYE